MLLLCRVLWLWWISDHNENQNGEAQLEFLVCFTIVIITVIIVVGGVMLESWLVATHDTSL